MKEIRCCGLNAYVRYVIMTKTNEVIALDYFARSRQGVRSIAANFMCEYSIRMSSNGCRYDLSCIYNASYMATTAPVRNGYAIATEGLIYAEEVGETFLITSQTSLYRDFYNHLMNRYDLPLLYEWSEVLYSNLLSEGRVLEEYSLRLNKDKAINCVVRVSNGYTEAKKLSEVISDGTVNVNTDYGNLMEIVGDKELLEMILQALSVTTNGGGSGGGDPGEYEDHGDYVIFEPLGENRPSVVWWTQLQYTNKYYGISPISSNGCGPSSLAIVYSSLTGDIRDPAQMAEWCYANGYAYTAGGQTVGTASIFSQGTKDLGLTVDYYGTGPDAFLEAVPYLEQGDLIVCNVGCYARGNSIFSGQGHFLVVRGYENGEIILADPGKRTAEQNTRRYPLSDMLQILDRRAVGNTGRVWAIGYDK